MLGRRGQIPKVSPAERPATVPPPVGVVLTQGAPGHHLGPRGWGRDLTFGCPPRMEEEALQAQGHLGAGD